MREAYPGYDPTKAQITAHEVRNVFQEALRKLDKELMPEKGIWSRDAIMKHFESIQYELYKRAGAQPPVPKGPKPKVEGEAKPLTLQEQQQALRARIKANNLGL